MTYGKLDSGARSLLAEMVLYHLAGIALLVLLLFLVPGSEPYLPVGGAIDMDFRTSTFEEVVETYRGGLEDRAYEGVARLAAALMVSIALLATTLVMWPISRVYLATHGRRSPDRSVYETLFLLPIVITVVVLLIKNSLALAFGLAGIVAGVQYRNRLKRPSDAAYVFAAIAVGISSGARAMGIALVMSLWFCVAVVLLSGGEGAEGEAE